VFVFLFSENIIGFVEQHYVTSMNIYELCSRFCHVMKIKNNAINYAVMMSTDMKYTAMIPLCYKQTIA